MEGKERVEGRERIGTDEAGEGTAARAEELPIVVGSGGERGKEGGTARALSLAITPSFGGSDGL